MNVNGKNTIAAVVIYESLKPSFATLVDSAMWIFCEEMGRFWPGRSQDEINYPLMVLLLLSLHL